MCFFYPVKTTDSETLPLEWQGILMSALMYKASGTQPSSSIFLHNVSDQKYGTS